MKPSDKLPRALAAAALIPALGLPLSNPDLFWHLSAAKRMFATGRIPAADWLSSTRNGAAWIDFEWASQLMYGALHRAGGMPALWLFKAALMAATAYLLHKLLELYTENVPVRAAAVSLWAAASLTRSDIRPELFSMIGFAAALLLLERRRLGLKAPHPFWFGALFCAWANLHPGFVYGLALAAFYADLPYFGAAAAGVLLQINGGAAEVLRLHWNDVGTIGGHITEWMGTRLDNPWHWPFWLALFAAFGSALLLLSTRPKRRPYGPLAALAFFGWFGAAHARMTGYFAACAIPLTVHFLVEAGVTLDAAGRRRILTAAAGAFAAFALACALSFRFGRAWYNDRAVPRGAADFLAGHPELRGRVLYNPWGWGGYLGWRLNPDYLVFQDGRYLFHGLLAEEAAALESPEAWQDFLARRGVELAVMQNGPYLDAYMPRDRWFPLFGDEKAAVFSRVKNGARGR